MPWTETARRQYRRACPRYASDLTDGEWSLIEPFMPLPPDRSPGQALPYRSPAQDRSARGRERGAVYGLDGLSVAPVTEGFPAALDGAALFLPVARQQAVADDPVPPGRAGARTRGTRCPAERGRDRQPDGENHGGGRG